MTSKMFLRFAGVLQGEDVLNLRFRVSLMQTLLMGQNARGGASGSWVGSGGTLIVSGLHGWVMGWRPQVHTTLDGQQISPRLVFQHGDSLPKSKIHGGCRSNDHAPFKWVANDIQIE